MRWQFGDNNNKRDNKKFINVKIESLSIIIFFVVTLVLYYKSLFGSFIFDDVIVILKEPLLKKENFFDFLKELPFKERPIRLLTFYFDRLIWGLNPFGYRFTNILIHISNGMVLYFFLLKLNIDKKVAFFSVAIFLWHFANPATVCYVTGRKDLLGFFLSLFAFLFLLKFKGSKLGIILFLLFYFLAFFTKEMFITLPLIVFAYIYIIEGKRVPKKYIIFAFISIIALTYFVIKFRDVSVGSLYKRLSIPEYFTGYLRLFFDPTFPCVDYVGYFYEAYKFSDINWLVFFVCSFVLMGYLFFTFLIAKSDRFLSFLLVSFLISLLPVLQIIQHSESFAEHYFYFPSAFMSIFFANLVYKIKHKKIALSLLILVCLFIIPLTYLRTKIFMNEENFWIEAFEKNPKSFRAKQYYGQKLLKDNKLDEALKIFEAGFEQTKKDYEYSELAYTYYYDFLNNLALVYSLKNDFPMAEKFYLKGLESIPESDKKQIFLFNLSILYVRKDREKGKDFIKKIVLENTNYKEISYLLYDLYWQDGEMDKLERFIDELLERDKKSYFPLAKKTLLLLKRGHKDKALELYEHLKRLSPANYYELNDIAEIEMYLNNYDRAFKYLLMAKEEKPDYGRTHKNLLKILEVKNK